MKIVTISLCCAIAAGSSLAQRLSVVGVDVIDIGSGTILENRVITVVDGTIEAVTDNIAIDARDRVIDGRGLYAMPGLIDSHVHLSASPETFAPLLLAHGVVLARDLGADTEYILSLRDRIGQGSLTGPDLLVTGAIIDGNPPVWPFSEAVETPEEARAAVRKLHEAGVDQIKLYSKLDADSFRAACDEANKLGLMTVGHVPPSVTLWEAAEAGMRTIEHMTGVPEAVEIPGRTRDDRSLIEQAINPWPRIDGATPEAIAAMAERAAATGVVHCPTLVVYDGIMQAGDPDPDDPRLRFIPESMMQFWSIPGYEEGAAVFREYRPMMTQALAALHQAGVTIIAGTDLANPYVFAGSSLHDEIANLTEAGMTNTEALQAATLIPALVFGVDDRFGSIKPGADASFVLLAGNPLDDLANLDSIEAVIHKGEYLNGVRLDKLKSLALAEATASRIENTRRVDSAELWEAKGIAIEGEVVTTGAYALKWGEFDAGTETFTLTRTDEGLNLYVHFNPAGGMQPPALTVYELSPDREPIAARHVPLRNATYDARYSFGADAITAVKGDDTQSLDRNTGTIPSGPNTSVEFFTLERLGLAIGDSVEGELASFGFPGWQLSTTPVVIERTSEATYRSTMTAEFGQMTAEVTLGDDGFPIQSTLTMPFGTLKSVRE